VNASWVEEFSELTEDGTNVFLVASWAAVPLQAGLVRLCRDPDLRKRRGYQARKSVGSFSWESLDLIASGRRHGTSGASPIGNSAANSLAPQWRVGRGRPEVTAK
jgi:hypothetical protein